MHRVLVTAPLHVWSWGHHGLWARGTASTTTLYVLLDILSHVGGGPSRPGSSARSPSRSWSTRLPPTDGQPVCTPTGHLHDPKPVAQLLADLGVARSHSRPQVSNDNPYSEAAFKTLKNAPVLPDRFGSLTDAGRSAKNSSTTTTTITAHSGSGWHTAASVQHRHRQQRPRRSSRHPSGGRRPEFTNHLDASSDRRRFTDSLTRPPCH